MAQNQDTADIESLAKARGKYAASAAVSFKRILHIEAMNKSRNERFEAAYAAKEADYRQRFQDLSKEQVQGLMEAFSRGYYAPEFNLMSEYQAKLRNWEELKEKQATHSPQERVEFEKLSAVANMNEYEYIGSRMLDHDVYKGIKETFEPGELKNVLDTVDAPIRQLAKNIDDSVLPKGIKRTHAATIDYFSHSKPDLKNEIEALKSKAKNDDEMLSFKQASAILRAGMVLHNPSGFLVSKGLSVLMGTKAMQPFAEGVKRSVDNMVEKSGIKSTLKKHMEKLSPFGAKMVAGGVAVAALATLTLTGVMDPTNAYDYAVELYQNTREMSEAVADVAPDAGISPFEYPSYASSDIAGENAGIFWEVDADTANENSPLDPEKMSIDVSGEATPQTVPDAPTSTTPDVPANSTPDVPANSTPDVPANSTPDVPTSTTPDVPTTTTPDVPTTTTPDVPTSTTPDVPTTTTPDAPADAVQGGVSATPSENTVADATGPNAAASQVDDAATQDIPAKNDVYHVMSGDNLSEIVAQKLEIAGIPYDYTLIDSYVDKIVDMNEQITDKHMIKTGWSIELPTFTPVQPDVAENALQNARDSITVMPEPISSEDVKLLKDMDMYPINDPVSPSIQKASEVLITPDYKEPDNGLENDVFVPQKSRMAYA
ncbi:MAG: hypothetical protein CBC55_03680 [Gammaproteobacteria bacterium TMED95]|nr:MAG: hypothetical protein CBC55_03680 [Gammaproteobacteria bacterium TMED95]